MSRRPTTYVEWRQVYHQVAFDLGNAVGWEFVHSRRLVVTRYTYELARRYERVSRRMDAEWEAFDATLAAEILKLVRESKS